jgi:hypothetical protein
MRVRYKSAVNASHYGSQKRDKFEPPTDPFLGQIDKVAPGRFRIYVGRDWAWCPYDVNAFAVFARQHGWHVEVAVTPYEIPAGTNAEGDEISRKYVTLTLTIGRNATLKTKGISYRLKWSTERTGVFERVSAVRCTTEDPTWRSIGTIGEIRPIIARNPVE